MTIFEQIKALDPFFNSEYNGMDDLGTSKLFADVNKGKILYNETAKSWFYYNGIKWCKDTERMKIENIAKEFSKSYQEYASGLGKVLNEKKMSAEERNAENDRLKMYLRHVNALGKYSVRKTIMDDARSYVHVSQNDFDTQTNLFNCRNVVVDLNTGRVLDHSPDLMLTKVANVEYDPDARCDRFDQFMKEIMCENAEKIRYLRNLFGYTMAGKNEREEAHFIYGSTTRNGKSTLMETIKYLFGDYGMNIQPESLAEHKKDGRSASGDIARLNGCRFLQMSEPPKNMHLDVALFKSMTGRDSITARRIYENECEFIPGFHLFINANHLPVVLDDTLFTSGRIKVITFDRHFEPDEQDTSLKDTLKSPESLSGILNWMLRGNREYRQNPKALDPPKDVIEATEAYRSNSNKLLQFLEAFSAENNETVVPCSKLYDEYVVWCKDNNFATEGKQSFMYELRKRHGYKESATIDGKTVRNVYSFC